MLITLKFTPLGNRTWLLNQNLGQEGLKENSDQEGGPLINTALWKMI